jgi:hypothetical protein
MLWGLQKKNKAVTEQIRDGTLKQLRNLWFVYSDPMRSKDLMLNISSHEDMYTTLHGSEISFMYDMFLYPTKL